MGFLKKPSLLLTKVNIIKFTFMTKEQLIQIAKAGFPERISKTIDFDKVEIHHMSGVYRLYDVDTPFNFMLPSENHLSIDLNKSNKFIQINAGIKAFNQYLAIKEIEKLGLI